MFLNKIYITDIIDVHCKFVSTPSRNKLLSEKPNK